MQRRPDASGFTLIEVLVAFTIAVVLLLPLMRGFSTGLLSAGRTDAVTEATLIAQSTLEGIGSGDALGASADVERQEGPYHVSGTVQRYHGAGVTTGSALAIVPYEVAVTVTWQQGARTRSVALRSLRLGSTPLQEQNP
jgi:prepilin-type N-terminal cleavage/methylation domain-containing protein